MLDTNCRPKVGPAVGLRATTEAHPPRRQDQPSEKGPAPYHPAMMVVLLLYAYAIGIYSSRRIAKACVERVDFMAIAALQAPDFRTVSEFRRRQLAALSGLFVQVLNLCEA